MMLNYTAGNNSSDKSFWDYRNVMMTRISIKSPKVIVYLEPRFMKVGSILKFKVLVRRQ